MPETLLVLRLEGVLQAWGLRSQWDVRDTGEEPSKSGVVGLLGCALGWPTADPRLDRLHRQLRMGVRVERQGSRLVDFQTVTAVMMTAAGKTKGTADDPATIISPRAYLQDAAFLVVLAGPAELLSDCRMALLAPRWPIYLGRRACPPTRPVFEALTDGYDSLLAALKAYPWEGVGCERRDERPAKLRIVWESRAGGSLRSDQLLDGKTRAFANREIEEEWIDFPG